jgi:integrase
MTNSRNSTFRLKFVQAWTDRDGRAHFYFRRAGYPRSRLPGLIGSTEFMEAYQAAFASAPEPIGATRNKPGSVSAAITSYYISPSFESLAPTSQVVRKAVLEAFRREHGDKLIAAMPRKFIAAMLDQMTPTAARNWFKAIRALVRHCIDDVELLKDDPMIGIKLRPIKGDGFHTWTEEEIAQFEAHHPIGSRERLALALGLYTGQRRGDVIRMGRQHIRDGALHVKQQKTGTTLAIPIHSELQAVIDATPGNQLTFLVTRLGKPFEPTSLTQFFANACKDAGLSPDCTFHGLRKAACRRLAEAGCNVLEIASISGHKTLSEVKRYTDAADQARLARNAMAKRLGTADRFPEEQSGTQTVKDDRGGLSKPLASLEKKPA